MRGALIALLLSLGGCYVSATGGPEYHAGHRQGTMLEFITGAEFAHLLGPHTAVHNGFGVAHADVENGGRIGGLYELAGSLVLTGARHQPERPNEAPRSAILQGDLGIGIGGYGGVPGMGERGGLARALALVGAGYGDNVYSLRFSGGVLAEVVSTGTNQGDGLYAPVVSVTVIINGIWGPLLDGIAGLR